MLGYTLFWYVCVCCPDGCMYVGFFAGTCGFVVSCGLITSGCFGRGVLGGFRQMGEDKDDDDEKREGEKTDLRTWTVSFPLFSVFVI